MYEMYLAKYHAEKLHNWPEWAKTIPIIEISPSAFFDLHEYSCSFPDSYARPISEGGQPWRRNLTAYNLALRHEEQWVYCEYVKHENPKLLGIIYKRIILSPAVRKIQSLV